MPEPKTRHWRFVGSHDDADRWSGSEGIPAVVVRVASPDHAPHDEDAAMVLERPTGEVWLAVADGAGGHPVGESASRTAIDCLVEHASEAPTPSVVDAVTAAHERIRQQLPGSATTLAVCVIASRVLRVVHAGDSGILVTGQRGRIKLRTIAHSPTGYAVEAGVLDSSEALEHEDRHVVSNLLGQDGMHVEVHAPLALSSRDTVVMGTDGLFDNLREEEVVEAIRTGPLEIAADRLRVRVAERMAGQGDGPSKPDDCAFILFRPGMS